MNHRYSIDDGWHAWRSLTSDPSLLKRIKYDVPICIPFVDGTVYSASIYDHTLCVIRVLSIVGKSCKDVST